MEAKLWIDQSLGDQPPLDIYFTNPCGRTMWMDVPLCVQLAMPLQT